MASSWYNTVTIRGEIHEPEDLLHFFRSEGDGHQAFYGLRSCHDTIRVRKARQHDLLRVIQNQLGEELRSAPLFRQQHIDGHNPRTSIENSSQDNANFIRFFRKRPRVRGQRCLIDGDQHDARIGRTPRLERKTGVDELAFECSSRGELLQKRKSSSTTIATAADKPTRFGSSLCLH